MCDKTKIGVSLLAGDLSCLQNECERIMESGADFIHLDIMDGHFVNNLTFGPPVIKCLQKKKHYIFDCHLMVSDPEKWIEPIYNCGGDIFTFHLESTEYPDLIIKKVKYFNMKCGIALNPETSIQKVLPYIDNIDLVLIMTVSPGFGGQKLKLEILDKINHLRKLYPNKNIEVDGGITKENIKLVKDKGANIIVSGTSLLNGNLKENIIHFRNI